MFDSVASCFISLKTITTRYSELVSLVFPRLYLVYKAQGLPSNSSKLKTVKRVVD